MLCACDLLNEGWDSPNNRFFSWQGQLCPRPCTQQLGRGIRLAQGKEYLMVFDLIDNASLFNAPYSLHRLFNIREYRPGEYILAPDSKRKLDKDLVAREKSHQYIWIFQWI